MIIRTAPSRRSRRGFTLTELLIVLLIVLLVSAATLPVVIPAYTERQVSEAARVLQAELAAARDRAIQANAPRGIRLLPDAQFPGPDPPLAYNRILAIETAPDYSEGLVTIDLTQPLPNRWPGIRINESREFVPGVLNPPTSWYWNIRQGDKIRIGESGRLYTIVGPVGPPGPNMLVPDLTTNPERFINIGPLETDPSSFPQFSPDGSQYLFLVNGQDDDGDGYIDNGFDGLDNDGDGVVDDIDEWEPENFVGPQILGQIGVSQAITNLPYTIVRRPVPTQGARETMLPGDVVIDMTTWDAPLTSGLPAERSRLPLDPATRVIDILMMPTGEVIESGARSSQAPQFNVPFFHFWLADREDVYTPPPELYATNPITGLTTYLPNPAAPNARNLLPLPRGTRSSLDASLVFQGEQTLRRQRRLVTLFTKTGQVTTTDLANFDLANPDLPFIEAQAGTRSSP